MAGVGRSWRSRTTDCVVPRHFYPAISYTRVDPCMCVYFTRVQPWAFVYPATHAACAPQKVTSSSLLFASVEACTSILPCTSVSPHVTVRHVSAHYMCAVRYPRMLFAPFRRAGKARHELHGFRRFYGAMFMCDECLALRAFPRAPMELFYGDFTAGARHRSTFVSHAEYMDSEEHLSPWTEVPGWSKAQNFWDVLHVVWLGTARDAAAACLVDLWEVFGCGNGHGDA